MMIRVVLLDKKVTLTKQKPLTISDKGLMLNCHSQTQFGKLSPELSSG